MKNTISLFLAVMAATVATAEESGVEAFIEPFKTIHIPAAEVGTIDSINVAEGDEVTAKQVLAKMDDSILRASLAAAGAAKDAVGNLRAAQAEVDLKKRQLTTLQDLRSRGNATQREIDRTIADHELATARLQSVHEDLLVRKFEYERILAHIERRVLRSPIDGVVSSIDKDACEFVGPTDPIVMTIVQLDPVQAIFSVPIAESQKIRQGDRVSVGIGEKLRHAYGFIDSIAPTADAKSGTVGVKVRIPNPKRQILSGSTCRWNIGKKASGGIARRQSTQSSR